MRYLIPILALLTIDVLACIPLCHVTSSLSSGVAGLISGMYWLVPLFAVFLLLSRAQGWSNKWPRKVTVICYSLIFILYFSKILIGAIGLIDSVRMFGDTAISEGTVERSLFMSRVAVSAGLIPLLLLIYGMIRNPYRYRILSVDVPVAGLPVELEGTRIVQISDIHAGSFLRIEPVRRSVHLINSLNADVVLFTGDLVNHTANEMFPFIEMFKQIEARYGVFSITGNHDYGDYMRWPSIESKQENFKKFKWTHQDLGWDLLLNAHRVLDINGKKIGIIGVENYSASRRFSKYGDLSAALSGLPPTDVNILLSHDPSHWMAKVVGKHPSIALTLSGHTHGFQFGIDIPGIFKWSPVQYVYKQWSGLYNEGAQFLYVNRGLGMLGYPGRVGMLPEITLLTLKGG